MIELAVGAATLVFATVGYLVASPALVVLALVAGGVSYGIVLARSSGS
jgi:hypothetical protein